MLIAAEKRFKIEKLNLPKIVQLMNRSALTDPKSGERCCFFDMNEDESNNIVIDTRNSAVSI